MKHYTEEELDELINNSKARLKEAQKEIDELTIDLDKKRKELGTLESLIQDDISYCLEYLSPAFLKCLIWIILFLGNSVLVCAILLPGLILLGTSNQVVLHSLIDGCVILGFTLRETKKHTKFVMDLIK